MRLQDRDDEGAEPELITPEDFLPSHPYPADARRLGIDQYSGTEAAWIGLAAALDPRRLSHRLLAITLLVLFLWPVVATIMFLLR